jgi:hypothetical protein
MDSVAILPDDQRRDLFRETASRKRISNAVAEKDFWVCWVLAKLFADSEISPKILFKDGTSLSKVFGLIERFSEDIDLILDWREITNDDPEEARSRTKQDLFNTKLQTAAQNYIRERLIPKCQQLLYPVAQVNLDPKDPQVITVRYPSAYSDAYIRPKIRLEIGPLAIWTPNDTYEIAPYCAEEFPALFTKKTKSFHVAVLNKQN